MNDNFIMLPVKTVIAQHGINTRKQFRSVSDCAKAAIRRISKGKLTLTLMGENHRPLKTLKAFIDPVTPDYIVVKNDFTFKAPVTQYRLEVDGKTIMFLKPGKENGRKKV